MKPSLLIATHAGTLAAGMLLGWFLLAGGHVVEGPAFEQKLSSGGVALRRDPDAKAPASVKQAAREVGGELERSVSVTVQPRPVLQPAEAPQIEGAILNKGCSCGPVTVDLGLVRMPDRTRRVVATSPDGDVVGGLDIPLDAAAAARSLHWAAGATFDPVRRELGAFIDRDLGPLRLGVEVQQRGDGVAAVLRAGIRF